MRTAHFSSVRNAARQHRLASLGVILFLLTLAMGAGACATAPVEAAPLLRTFNPTDIVLLDGYQIEHVATALSVPTPALFQGSDLLVPESGWGGIAPARTLRVRADGAVVTVASTGLQPPVMGLALWHEQLYVSDRGRVSVVQPHAGASGSALSPGGRFGFQTSAFVAMFGTSPAFLTEGETPASGTRIVRVEMNGPVLVPPPNRALGGGQLAAAPALSTPSQDTVRIISLIVGSFVIAIGAMVLARRYWMR